MPEVIDGLSLVNLLTRKGDWRSSLLLEAWPDRGNWVSIHTDQYVYIETVNDKSEFYDLAVDPYEMENAIDDPQYQSIIQQLKQELQKDKEPRIPEPPEE